MKYLIATIFLAVSIQSIGQFNKGDKVLGGTLSLSTSKNDLSEFETETNYTTIGIYPNFGVLMNNNLEIGGQLGYSSNHDEWSATNASSDRKSNYFTIGLYAQRYFVISDQFLFSLTTGVSYGTGKEKTLITNQNGIEEDETKSNNISVALRPSFIFFPSQNWGLHASIGELHYTHSKNKTDDNTSNQFGINYGYVNFGIAYYFRRETE